MNTTNTLSALDAAMKVLQESKSPLHYREITKRVLTAGLWKSNGKTPEATINARLAVDVKTKGKASASRRRNWISSSTTTSNTAWAAAAARRSEP